MKLNYIFSSIILHLLNTFLFSRSHKYQYKLFDENGTRLATYATSLSVLTLELSNGSHTLEFQLIRNRILIAKNYQESLIDGKHLVKLKPQKNVRSCYYDNRKSSKTDSSFFVAVNFCDGLNGVMKIDGVEYGLSEIGDGEEGGGEGGVRWVNVERVQAMGEEFKCGVEKQIQRKFNFPRRRKRQSNVTQKYYQDYIDEEVKIIEIFVVIDYPVYDELYHKDQGKALRQMRMVAQVSNRLFQQLEIFVVLVGVEIWTNFHFDIPRGSEMDALVALSRERYNKLLFDLPPHDVMLFSIRNPGVSAIGFAFVGTLCSSKYSTLWFNDMGTRVVNTGILVTHEMSHLFSLTHNHPSCRCASPSGRCIMDTSIDETSVIFSKCSVDMFNFQFGLKKDYCLHNLVPYHADEAVCGNGFVEEEEECDCGGRRKWKCNPLCCDEDTCRLKSSGSECASGLCCDIEECKLRPKDYICRPAKGECDVDDLCDGVSGLCPIDKHHHDGKLCHEDNYCFEGTCIHAHSNCEYLFGSGIRESPKACYDINTRGTPEGNCQIQYVEDKRIVTACSEKDKLCGSVFCDVEMRSDFVEHSSFAQHYDASYLSKNLSSGHKCIATEVMSSDFDFNPGYIFNGRKCGENKMCFQKSCVDRQMILDGDHKKLRLVRMRYSGAMRSRPSCLVVVVICASLLLS